MKLSVMKGSSGLRTQTDPSRSAYRKDASPYSGNVGLVDFAACLNIDITDTNMVMRRRATRKKVPQAAHSLWPVEPQYCLFVSGDGLYLLLPDFAGYRRIATIGTGKMSCAVVDQIAYWVNGTTKGKVVNGINQEWVKANTIYSHNKTRVFDDPPVGTHIAYHDGRVYVLDGKVIWYSESYGPDLFSKADSFLSLESPGSMVRPVAGGIYISDAIQTWFVSGNDPAGFTWRVVDNHPALPFSDKSAVGAMQLNPAPVFTAGGKSEVAFWLTNRGVMFGDANGMVTNMTEEKIDLFPSIAGAVLVDGTNLTANFIQ